MKILHTADWHFDLGNMENTAGAIFQWMKDNPDAKYDVLVHAGDFGIHRGHIHPHTAWMIRRAITALAERAWTTILVSGNHDQAYHSGRAGVVRGIFDAGETRGTILVESQPVTKVIRDSDGLAVAFVCVPTPNKYLLKSGEAATTDEFSVLMRNLIQGEIAAAKTTHKADRTVVVYHGTIGGAMASDEMVMAAGMDLTIPREAFAGADAVMLGHIHKPQDWKASETTPPIVYSGAIAPLTWGDKALRPRMVEWHLTPVGVSWEATPVPVMAQLLHFDLEVAGADADQVGETLARFLTERTEISAGDRVRIKVAAPKDAMAGITAPLIEALRDKHKLQELKVVPDPVDDQIVRLDLADGWGIPEAFEKYLNFMAVPAEDRPALREICAAIEAQVEDRHLDKRYDFEPCRMEIQNWCQYHEAAVDFSEIGPVVAITGDNFAGKSNLSRALLFALYKKQVSGTRISDLVRHGESAMRVRVEFKSHGQKYSITRSVKISGAGKATGDLVFCQVAPDGHETPINEGTANETQAAIERIIGPLPIFMATTFSGQNQIDKILDLTPAELKDLLMSVLQRDFEGRQEIAASEIKLLDGEIRDIEAKQSVWMEMASTAGAAEERADLCRRALDALEADRATASEILETAEAEMREAREAAAWIGPAQEALAELEGYLENTRRRIQETAEAIEVAEDAARRAAEIRDQIGDPIDIGEISEAKDAAVARLRDVEKQATTATAEDSKKLDEVRDYHRENRAEAAAAARAIEDAERELAAACRAADLLDAVPCRGVKIVVPGGPAGPEPADGAGCQFLRDAAAAASTIEDLDQKREVARERLAALDQAEARICEDIAALEAKIAERKAELAAAIADAKRELNQVHEKWTEAISAVENQRKARERLAELADQAGRREPLEAQFAELQAAAAAAEAKIAEKRAAIEKNSGAGLRLADAEAAVAKAKQVLKENTEAITKARADLEKALAAVETARKAKEQADENQAKADKAKARRRDFDFYRRAMHRDGLPFMLLENFAIPAMQRLMNEYLGQTTFRVAVTSEKELISGDARNQVNIRFIDHRGEHDKSAASGFQRTAIGMAAMAALADLNAEATGSKIWLTVQDEGFGTMTPENLEGAKAMIRQIGARRGWFLFISHIPGMAEIADTEILITDNAGVSSATVQ